MTKASETDFEYPLIGFTAKPGPLWFSDFFALSHCSSYYVENEALIGMELVDSRLRRWIVRSLDLKTPLKPKRWWNIFGGASGVEFDLELEAIEPISFDALKPRVAAEIEIEDPDVEVEFREARDLATIYDVIDEQGTGLL